MNTLQAGRRAIDVVAVIDQQPLSGFQLEVFLLCALTAMIDGFDTQCVGFAAPTIMREWQVHSAEFGLIFGSGLLGVLIGSVLFSPLADRLGRRQVIIVAALVFGIFSLATAWAATLPQLLILRFVTGLGLGSVVPNIIALTAEYSPRRLRSRLVVIMFTGFPLGGLLGGLVSTGLMASFGWRSIFVFGGVLPLVLCLLLLWRLPESIPFLLHRRERRAMLGRGSHRELVAANLQAASYLARVAPGCCSPQDHLFVPETTPQRGSVRDLFSDGRALGTLMLWTIFFCTLMMFYFMISWLPTILANAGVPVSDAIFASLSLNAGSVIGGMMLAHYVDRKGSVAVLVVNYLGAGLCYSLLGFIGTQPALVTVLVFCVGFFVGGAQLVANAIASTIYPTSIRSGGIGWAVGAGRVGSLSGPTIGGFLLTSDLSYSTVFLIAAVPALFAAASSYCLAREARNPGNAR